MDKKLQELEKQYMKVPIPKELDFVVERALKQGRKKEKKIVHLNGSLDLPLQPCYLQQV